MIDCPWDHNETASEAMARFIAFQNASKLYWQLYAFGLTPLRLPLRLHNAGAPKVLCTTIPKAGTNLVLRALCLHPLLYRRLARTVTDPSMVEIGPFDEFLKALRPGQVVATHLRYSRERDEAIRDSGVRHIFVVRDPRDVVLSTAFYTVKEKDHYLHDLFESAGTLKARLKIAIEGYAPLEFQSIGDRLADSAGWLRPPTHVVRFEDLVGDQGGGTRALQNKTLRDLFAYIDAPTTETDIVIIGDALFSPATRTFRKGRIGQWQEHFDDETRDLFKAVAQDELVRYAYEKDDNW